MNIPWIYPATVVIVIAYFATRKRDALWARALSKFLLPFALAMPAVVALQFLQNRGVFSATQTVAIESASREANALLKDVTDLSFLQASALLLVAVLLELLAPRWKAVSGYLRATRVLAFCSGILAALSCFTFTTSKEFKGDVKAVKQALQARLGSEKEEHFNVKVHERVLSAQKEAIHQNLAMLLKLRAVSVAVHARMENSSPNLEPDVEKDPEYGQAVVKLAKSQVTKFLSRGLERLVFRSVTPNAEHPNAPALAASTAAALDGLATTQPGKHGGQPRLDLIGDVGVLQKAVDQESAALAEEKKAEDQVRQAMEEESSSVFDTMIDPLKDRIKGLIETLSGVDNEVIRKGVGDLVGNVLDEALDKVKERLSARTSTALKKALAPVDELAAHAYVDREIQRAHGLYDADLKADVQKAGTEYEKWRKGAVADAAMSGDLFDLRMAFIRDAVTEPAADESIFDHAQVLRPLEANLVEIERDWAPKFEEAQKTIETNREAAEKDGDDKLKDVEDRDLQPAEHPEPHPI